MKVKDFIEELKKFDENIEIKFEIDTIQKNHIPETVDLIPCSKNGVKFVRSDQCAFVKLVFQLDHQYKLRKTRYKTMLQIEKARKNKWKKN